MSHYLFNRQDLLQKVKHRYHKGDGSKRAAQYYLANTEILKGEVTSKCRNLSEQEKEVKRA